MRLRLFRTYARKSSTSPWVSTSFRDYHVELMGAETCISQSGINPIQYIPQAICTCDFLVGIPVQAVEADVDPPEAAVFEIGCEVCKERPVCGDG